MSQTEDEHNSSLKAQIASEFIAILTLVRLSCELAVSW